MTSNKLIDINEAAKILGMPTASARYHLRSIPRVKKEILRETEGIVVKNYCRKVAKNFYDKNDVVKLSKSVKTWAFTRRV